MADTKRLIKLVRYMLVYRPDEFGLIPDNEGFVKIKDLHLAITETDGFRGVRRKELESLFEVFAREQFEYRRDLGLVRTKDQVQFTGVEYTENPPARLYLPVKPRAWLHISEKGWQRPDQAIMTPDKDLAEKLARRKGGLLIEVDTVIAREEGGIFFRFIEKLYLSPWLPAKALRGPKVDEKFRARYAPKPKAEPEPEPIIPFRPDTQPPELPYRKITRGKKKKIPWKTGRKEKKKGDW
ncbi:MAG TPA: hypothetical protein EYP81_04245 [Thermodesulfobacteriaceae bacterium]|nr:hypothetical protein [Thermodesulfobacteriaceae bacterium]